MNNSIQSSSSDLSRFLINFLRMTELKFTSRNPALSDADSIRFVNRFLFAIYDKYSNLPLVNTAGDFSFIKKILHEVVNNIFDLGTSLKMHYAVGIIVNLLSNPSKNKEALRMISVLKSLSLEELRTHFLIYNTLNKRISCNQINFSPDLDFDLNFDLDNLMSSQFNLDMLEIFLPSYYYMKSMCFTETEYTHNIELIFAKLSASQILSEDYRFHCSGYKSATNSLSLQGISVSPSILGIFFYVWAFASGDTEPCLFFSSNFKSKIKNQKNTINFMFEM